MIDLNNFDDSLLSSFKDNRKFVTGRSYRETKLKKLKNGVRVEASQGLTAITLGWNQDPVNIVGYAAKDYLANHSADLKREVIKRLTK